MTDAAEPKLSLLVVTRRTREDGESHLGDLTIERETTDHGEAHSVAEAIAKVNVGEPARVLVYVYRRVAVYEAEIKVRMTGDVGGPA